MDYFAEIAESPDLDEALRHLSEHHACLSELQQMCDRPGLPPLCATHPSIWRTELINWFYLHPGFAAAVWRQLQRVRLARAAGLLPWPPERQGNQLLRELGLDTTISEKLFWYRLTKKTAQPQSLEDMIQKFELASRGPEFIERLLVEWEQSKEWGFLATFGDMTL